MVEDGEAPELEEGSDSLEGAGDELSRLEAEMRTAQKRILSAKRKRGPKGGASASTSDSAALIEWWSNALCCKNASVLVSMMAHSKRAAREAANATLRRQAQASISVANNAIIRDISGQNAVDSAQALASSFVTRKPHEAPTWLCWDLGATRYVGMARTYHEACTTTAHACARSAPRWRGRQGWRLRGRGQVLQFAPRSDGVVRIPGLLERLSAASSVADRGGQRHAVMGERMGAAALGQAEPPRSVESAGIARSTLSFRATLRCTPSQRDAGARLHDEVMAKARACTTPPRTDSSLPTLQWSSDGSDAPAPRTEPLCTPASWLAVGLGINEEVRTWKVGKSRKNDPLKVQLGVSSDHDKQKDVPNVLNSEPPPLLTVVDYNLDVIDSAEPWTEAPNDADGTRPLEVGVALHVCGDSAIRVPEVLAALTNEDADDTEHDGQSYYRGISIESALRKRAVLWAASSQASYISNVGPVVAAGAANTAVQGSKKVSVPDTNRWLGLSAFDAYAAGLVGVEPSFLGTAHAGVYGCPSTRASRRRASAPRTTRPTSGSTARCAAARRWRTTSRPSSRRSIS